MTFFTQAYAATDTTALSKLIGPISQHIIYPVIELLFSVAVLVFVYGVLQMVFHSVDSEERKNGRNSMLGGIIGIFIMLSAWGIVYLISGTIKGL